MKVRDIVELAEAKTVLGSRPRRNPLYLGPTERVPATGPILGAPPKKQTKLTKKFFGSS